MKSARMPNPIDPGGTTYQANGNIRAQNKSMLLQVMQCFFIFLSIESLNVV